jgi:thiol:disulfide interchange protein DsbA
MKSRFALVLLALLPWMAVAATPVEGTDYVVIPDGKPFAPLNGKVEVVEVFGYTCIHCANFQPQVDAWKKKQPAYVRFTPVPAAFGGFWIPYARAYYAAEKLGVLGKTHNAVFKALHEDGSLPIQNASAEEIAAFYARYGANAKAFAATMGSPEVDAKLARSKEFVRASEVEGTPTVIVNGKYRVTGRSLDQVLSTTDYLVARERAARK